MHYSVVTILVMLQVFALPGYRCYCILISGVVTILLQVLLQSCYMCCLIRASYRLFYDLFTCVVMISLQVLSLPSFIWKQLSGEKVTWSRDFVTVDAAEVCITVCRSLFVTIQSWLSIPAADLAILMAIPDQVASYSKIYIKYFICKKYSI